MSNEIIKVNQNRIEFSMKKFSLSEEELLSLLNQKRTRKFKKDDVFSDHIKTTTLKNIDKIFSNGLNFYTDPINMSIDTESSIFFRKDRFNSSLSIEDKKFINETEKEIFYIKSLKKSIGVNTERKLSQYNISDNAKEVALKIRSVLITSNERIHNDKDFLKFLINTLSNKNIFVFEKIDPPNKKNKSNLNGFFIQPNFVVIKRQSSLKREIFTLLHELGHYLLNNEELDKIDFSPDEANSKEEIWCNDFAFHFLMNNQENIFEEIPNEHIKLSNKIIDDISKTNHISKLAITYNLAKERNLWEVYTRYKTALDAYYAKKKNDEKINLDMEKEQLKKEGRTKHFSPPKPIFSPLEKEVYSLAYFDGIIDEIDILSHFKPYKNDLDRFLYE